MIRNLSQLSGQTILITQPSIWKNNFELKYDEELLGKVSAKSAFRSNLIINLFENEWEIYSPKFWKSEIAVREKGKENPFATYDKKLFSREGTVFLPKGQRLKIKFGLIRGKYGVYTTSGRNLVTIKDLISFKANTEIYIETNSEFLDKYPWVIILAWYLTRKRKQAAAAG
jgi:hypothetical protein